MESEDLEGPRAGGCPRTRAPQVWASGSWEAAEAGNPGPRVAVGPGTGRRVPHSGL